MKTTKWTTSIYLGEKGGERFYLEAPKWECGRYRGCGYVESKNSHQHFDDVGLEMLQGFNSQESELDTFGKILQDEGARRDLIAIMTHVYHYKNRAEFLKNGGNVNKLGFELLDDFKSKTERMEEIRDINEKILPKLFDMIADKYC